MGSKKVNLWLDVILTVGLAMAMMPGITGAPMHRGIGVALGVGVIIHLLLHYKWIVAVSKSFMKLSDAVRLKLVLNSLSLLAFSLTIVSGLVNAGFHWHVIHHAAALLTLLTVALHLALHRRRSTSATKRSIPESPLVREINS